MSSMIARDRCLRYNAAATTGERAVLPRGFTARRVRTDELRAGHGRGRRFGSGSLLDLLGCSGYGALRDGSEGWGMPPSEMTSRAMLDLGTEVEVFPSYR